MAIISTGSRVDTPYDVYLEVDNQKVGFMLNATEGITGYRASLADQVTPQFNTASYDYASVPIEVEIPVAYENWQGGCAFNSVEYEEAGSLTKYSFTRGVDASYAGRLYSGPYHFPNTNSGSSDFFTQGDSNTPTIKFLYAPSTATATEQGVWAIGGRKVYKHSSGTVWTEVTAMALSAGYYFSDIIDFNNTLFLAVAQTSNKDPVNYYYSTNGGATWTQSSLANSAVLFFAIRGETSGSAVLWSCDGNGRLRTNVDGTNTGGAWSSPIAMGTTTNDWVTGLDVVASYVYVFKANSIWRTDGTDSVNVWQSQGDNEVWSANAGNGSSPYVWIDGNCYVQYGRRVLQIDAVNNNMTIVWPPSAAQVGSEELDGRITSISGDSDWLYFSLVNSIGVSYIMKGKPNTTNWHTLTFTETPAVKGIYVAGNSILGSTNPWILYGTDGTGSNPPSAGALRGVVLPKTGMLPDTDPDYKFAQSTENQYIVGPWMDVGQAASPKLLNGARVLSRNANESSPTTLSYVTDSDNYQDTFIQNVQRGDITGTVIGTATDDDATFSISTEVRFNKIRYILKLARPIGGTNVASIESVVLDATIAPERRRLFEMDFLVADDLPLKGGGKSRYGAKVAEEFLFNSANRLITLTDIFNRTYSVKMLSLRSAGVIPQDGRDTQVYTVSFAEINQLTDIGDVLIYDTSAWNTGRIYS
jgi:hypothetical protein